MGDSRSDQDWNWLQNAKQFDKNKLLLYTKSYSFTTLYRFDFTGYVMKNDAPLHMSAKLLLIAPLHAFSRIDLEQAGGKAANLGELIQAGFPVPGGFVITTAAYDRFVAGNALGAAVAQAAGKEPGSSASLRSAFESAPIPPEVVQDILEAYHRLGSGPVAVRSSATAEDLPEAAFAGQQDTFLNVAGAEALTDAVRRCWASLWSDRAIAYRTRQGLDQRTVKLAVVIQRMVAAEIAGVLFTANPVTGERNETVIDSSPGLGEAVVSGQVTPDHLVLRKRRWGWSVIERKKGRREVIIRPRPGGGTELIQGSSETGSLVLSDRELRKLAGQGAAIQRHFGSPQDVEWAWAGGKLFILQARPITALPDPPPHPGRPVQMLTGMFSEMFPVRPYPLDQTTWLPAISDAAVQPIFSLIGIEVPPLHRQFVSEDGVVIRFSGKVAFHPTPAILLAPLRIVRLSLQYDSVHWHSDPLLAEAQARARALEASDLGETTWEDLLVQVRETLSLALPLAGEIRRRYYPRALLCAGILRVILGLLGQGSLFSALLSGLESKTLEANRALEGLAKRIRTDPALAGIFAQHQAKELWAALEQQAPGRQFLALLQTFLDQYGHREVVFSTVRQPTWKDAPEIVLGLLKGLALMEPQQDTGQPSAWENAQDRLLAHPLLRLSPPRTALLRLMEAARRFWQIREDTHFEATRLMPILRRILLELGRRLAETGIIEDPLDVFHLEFTELECLKGIWPPSPGVAAELHAAVIRRKKLREALEGIPVIDPRLYHQREPVGDILLRGTAGSPGIAEGPVRVIHEASEFGELRPGEVLVAPYTNPAWTPLFQRVAAVVVDGGAAGSHAAIVAREYGVPAVMGTVTGTQKLQNGEWVRVDGDRGIVQPAQGPDSILKL
jgi:pyruvate,water dikinase